jgi:ketosteroid isomerase-like protein
MTESLDPTGDQWEIRQLIERYAAAADRVDGEAAAALFTDDAVLVHWLEPASAEPTGTVRGPVAIAAAINRLAGYRATHHAISSSIAEVDGDRAAGETRCIAHHLRAQEDQLVQDHVLYLCYLDQFTRVDARWRFTRRELRVLWASVHPVEAM